MSAQHNQISRLGHWKCTKPPSAPSPRSCTASPTINSSDASANPQVDN